MADESKFTLYEDDDCVGTFNKDGSVKAYPASFMGGQPFNRTVTHAKRRIDGKYFICFPAGVPQEGDYKVKSGKRPVSPPSATSAAPSPSKSSVKDGN